MNIIWVLMILFSVISAIFTDNISELSQKLLSGIQDAVTLTIKLLGMFCFWGGITNIAEKSGFTKIISRILSPAISFLFKDISQESKENISMSITADMLGIGNAATPLGIKAMKSFEINRLHPETATNNMIIFVVLNTASIRIIPTSIAMIRSQYGCESPFDILPATILASACSLIVGLTLAKILGGRKYE